MTNVLVWLGSIRKALTPIVVGGIGWATLIIQSPSGPITSSEWLVGGTILASALGVYAVTNGPAPTPAPPAPLPPPAVPPA